MTLSDIPVFCISLQDFPVRRNACAERLKSQGIDFTFFDGVHGELSGLSTTQTYRVDHPNSPYTLTNRQVGIYLSHWILWKGLSLGHIPAKAVMIIEDDADFLPGWRDITNAALAGLPDDWDYLAPGNCDCGNLPPGVHENRPLATHCYIVKTASLPKLIDPLRRVWAPLDLAMYYEAFPRMRVFSILPRVVDQVGMNLNP